MLLLATLCTSLLSHSIRLLARTVWPFTWLLHKLNLFLGIFSAWAVLFLYHVPCWQLMSAALEPSSASSSSPWSGLAVPYFALSNEGVNLSFLYLFCPRGSCPFLAQMDTVTLICVLFEAQLVRPSWVSFEWTPSVSKPGSDFWSFSVFLRHDWIRSFVFLDGDSLWMSDVSFKLNDVSVLLASKGFCITWFPVSPSFLEHGICSEPELGWWFVRSTGEISRLIAWLNPYIACRKDAVVYQM